MTRREEGPIWAPVVGWEVRNTLGKGGRGRPLMVSLKVSVRRVQSSGEGLGPRLQPETGRRGSAGHERSVKLMGIGLGREWGPGKSQRGTGQRREEGRGESNTETRVSSKKRLAGPEGSILRSAAGTEGGPGWGVVWELRQEEGCI